MQPHDLRGRTRSHPNLKFRSLPTASRLRGTGGVTGCNLVLYEVSAVRTRILNPVPRNTDGLPTSGNWRRDRVQPHNLRSRLRSRPNLKYRSPNYSRIPDFQTGRAFRVLSLNSKRAVSSPGHWKSIPHTHFIFQYNNFRAQPLEEHSMY